ncbi:MAG: hypothetical protein RBR06_11410 [Desulfuromonadaceae bacterium]|nr:hypothetical protein [Desulfuromonadaceae bacterium]
MKNILLVIVLIAFALVTVFLAQHDGNNSPITKVVTQEPGVYAYKGATRGEVVFNHNTHSEMMGCADCHGDTPGKIDVSTMEGGHGLCASCHNDMGIGECSKCHSK